MGVSGEARPAVVTATGRTQRRIAHLDGLRGVAIALVVVAHLMQKLPPFPGYGYLSSVGGMGVYIFFALSGYLITALLVREHHRHGRISLRRFYVRRTLRIMPAFYVMLGVMLALAALTVTISISTRSAVLAGLFVSNTTAHPIGWWLTQTWSLSVEEQFYLLWPLLLVWLRPSRALTVALAALVVEPVVRTACFVLVPSTRVTVGELIPTHADALLIGAALALLATERPDWHARLLAVVVRYHLGLVAAVVLPLNQLAFDHLGAMYLVPIGWSIESLAVVLLLAAMERPSWTRTAMSWRPLVLLGLVSYSLYLWQEVYLSGSWQSGVMASPAACVLLALATAVASYVVVERPTTRLGRRLTRDPAPAGDVALRAAATTTG